MVAVDRLILADLCILEEGGLGADVGRHGQTKPAARVGCPERDNMERKGKLLAAVPSNATADSCYGWKWSSAPGTPAVLVASPGAPWGGASGRLRRAMRPGKEKRADALHASPK
jgi:hypothetical protein